MDISELELLVRETLANAKDVVAPKTATKARYKDSRPPRGAAAVHTLSDRLLHFENSLRKPGGMGDITVTLSKILPFSTSFNRK
eukprot:gene16821-25791_t